MGKQALRFGICDGAGHRAATWKLWTQAGAGKSDVYLTCREMRDSLKMSLHESGQWHVAFSQRTFAEDVKGAIPKFKDPYIEKWLRPSNFAPGFTLALSIVTPWSAVTTSVKEGEFKGVTCLPSAPEPMAARIDILITEPPTRASGWPGRQSMGTSFIGSFPLENGKTMWAVYLFVDMPDFSSLPKAPPGWFFKGKSAEDLKDLKEGDLRVFMAGAAPDGSQVIYDCAVQISR